MFSVGDEVVFLIDYHVCHGTIIKVNRTTYSVAVPSQNFWISGERKVKHSLCIGSSEPFVVVCREVSNCRYSYYLRTPRDGEVDWRASRNYVNESYRTFEKG